MAKASIHMGLRGSMHDTKICRSNEFSRPRQHTSCSSQVFFPRELPSLTCFIVLACLGFRITHVIRGSGTYRKKVQTLVAQPRTAWAPADFCSCGSPCRKQLRFAPCCSKVCWDRRTLQCVLAKNMFSLKPHHHAQSVVLDVTTPALSVCPSRLPW